MESASVLRYFACREQSASEWGGGVAIYSKPITKRALEAGLCGASRFVSWKYGSPHTGHGGSMTVCCNHHVVQAGEEHSLPHIRTVGVECRRGAATTPHQSQRECQGSSHTHTAPAGVKRGRCRLKPRREPSERGTFLVAYWNPGVGRCRSHPARCTPTARIKGAHHSVSHSKRRVHATNSKHDELKSSFNYI